MIARIVLGIVLASAVTFMFVAPIKGFKWRK